MATSFPGPVEEALAAIAADASSGATALVLRAVALLRAVAGEPALLGRVAAAVQGAQPAMAGFRTAAAVAIAAADPTRELDRLAARIRRAPQAIAAFAGPLIQLRRGGGTLTVVTISHSASVEHTLVEVGGREPLRVRCAESQPGGEGAGLAAKLVSEGIVAEVYADTAIAAALESADAVVVGADALAAGAFVNKAGTAGLTALAQIRGVPCLVLAGREKILPAEVFGRLRLPLREVQTGVVARREQVFERVDGVSATVVTDGGAADVVDVESMSLWSPSIYECYARM
jgi:translation initiation factor 2B subunit (eIF-2B alpha/beta/delta family)